MNPLSFVLAIGAIIVFLAGWRATPWAHLGLGLALLTAAWIVQLVWVTTSAITIGG